MTLVRLMLQHLGGKRRFIILLPTIPQGQAPHTEMVNERAAIVEAYPNEYLDIPAVLAAAGNGSAEDNEDIEVGYTPRSLLSDTVHLNAAGQAVVAAAVVSFVRGKGWAV